VQQVLAETEAGVWHCSHGGHANRSDSLCNISTPCKTPIRANDGWLSAPVAHFAGIIDARPTPVDRIVILITAFLFAQVSK
jgi:hypothetical protein